VYIVTKRREFRTRLRANRCEKKKTTSSRIRQDSSNAKIEWVTGWPGDN